MFYYEVTVREWNGGERTWDKPVIFATEEEARAYASANENTLCKTGREAIRITRKTFGPDPVSETLWKGGK